MQALAIGTRVMWYDQPGMIINMLNKVHKVVLEKDLSTVLAKETELKEIKNDHRSR